MPYKHLPLVPRSALQVHSDGHEITINVEYNQLDPLLRATPGDKKTRAPCAENVLSLSSAQKPL